ncbi:MAG: DUF4838 domain-containing protein [Bacteroidota bacterium]
MKKSCILILLLFSRMLFAAEPVFNIGGQNFPVSGFEIVVSVHAGEVEMNAAKEFQKYLGLVTGVIPSVTDASSARSSHRIIIASVGKMLMPDIARLPDPDGFIIQIHPGGILIAGGSHKGTLYGVYEFLEKYLGCHFWAPKAAFIPEKSVITLPVIDRLENPAFSSREVYYAGMDEQDFADKMRTDRHAWKGGENWGLWVHTMFTLVSPEKYFYSHPEYFALMGGKRTKTQLCLTNPDVLQTTIDALKMRMKERPEARYWSVSQMDTFGSCECDACRAIDEREGSSSGSMIAFVNQVAAAFPDKVISTLAYQYTRKAPRYIKLASNVNIMLCTIECDRSMPLESDSTAGSFSNDLRNWSAIASDILVWDYVIQFTNMIGPFPNLPVLQPNIQLFKKYQVSSVFEQGCHGTYSENQELRQYLLAKLLWNPELNVDSLTNQFLTGYYGPAGQYIGEYLKGMAAALKESGKTLWIYGSPMQETDAFLSPDNINYYRMLFAHAEKAVAADSILLGRVIKARLPLDYATLEITKRNITGPDGFMLQHDSGWVVRPDIVDKVNDFVALLKRYDVKTVHERSLPPDVYGKQTIDFFNRAYSEHLAKGKPYVLAIQPASKYSAEGAGSLTDGKRGSSNYYVLWQGFEENDLTAMVDLKKQTEINYVGAEFLQDLASWIFYPGKVVISVSDNGTEFKEVAVFDSLSFADPVLILETGKMIKPVNTRYVRFYARNTGKCPAWHIGHGGKAWLFADELIADRR